MVLTVEDNRAAVLEAVIQNNLSVAPSSTMQFPCTPFYCFCCSEPLISE